MDKRGDDAERSGPWTNAETTQTSGRQRMGRGRIREEVGSRPAQGLGWSSVPVAGSGWSSATTVRPLCRGRADAATAAAAADNDDETGRESGLGAVEEGPAEQEGRIAEPRYQIMFHVSRGLRLLLIPT